MNDWTSGYVAEIDYTYGYYTELNPLRVQLAFIDAGLAYPEFNNACELGYGQGVSVNIHSAASVTRWYGTDFNPAQARFAQELAAVSGSGAQLFDQAFDEFCSRSDLPEFEFIGVHGIWSWISDANRATIVDFVRRKLKLGGVLYISYNTQPGWAAMVPMRDLLVEHARLIGSLGQGIASRIDGALAFADKLLAANPQFARVNPVVTERIKQMKDKDRNYLAHEYFNRDWHPMSFTRMAEWLGVSKSSFGCSATYLEHVGLINLAPDQQALLDGISDPVFKEAVRDFCVNQQFRRDYWVKGARRLDPLERTEALRALRLILVNARAQVSLKVNGALGEAGMSEAIYNPVLDALADHRPRTFGEIEQSVKDKGISLMQLLQVVMILAGKGDVLAVQEDKVIAKARAACDRLNAQLLRKARSGGEIISLASPVTGGGVVVGRFQQLFLLARAQGKKQPAEWVDFVWKTLQMQGQRLLKDGKTLETDDENLAELRAHADTFAQAQLPILKVLQVA